MDQDKPAIASEFNGSDRRRLTQALKRTQEAALYQRIQAVWLLAQGYALSDVMQVTHSSKRSIYRWARRYLRTRCIHDLQDAPRPGRPKAAPTLTAEQILEALQRDPLDAGYTTTVWTVPLLAQYLTQRYGCSISAYTLRRRIKQIGLRWKRPRYVFITKEPHRAQKKGLLHAASSSCSREMC